MINNIIYIFLNVLSFFINLIPLELRIKFFKCLIITATLFVPRLKKIALVNLKIVFPNLTKQQHINILKANYESLALFLVDLFRLPLLDDKWFDENIEVVGLDEYKKLKSKYPDKGILFLTGHFGSLELLGQCVGHFMEPIDFVARDLKPEGLDRWWNKRREVRGNDLIKRQGAVNNIIRKLVRGRSVGIVFDQNIIRKYAIFIDWFGKSAATTMTVSKIALQFKCPICIVNLYALPSRKYRFKIVVNDNTDIYETQGVDDLAKGYLVTERAVRVYEKLILESPSEWFWFHRRWKTALTDEQDNLLYR